LPGSSFGRIGAPTASFVHSIGEAYVDQGAGCSGADNIEVDTMPDQSPGVPAGG
jgi:hypothetical protein